MIITNIFLLEDLRLDNYSVGGLSNGYDMWLKVKQYHGEYYDFNLVVLHHEFSSNILKRNYQNIRKWSVFSEDYYGADESKSLGDFEYSRSGDHLTYAQGATAELVAAITIGLSTAFKLPVSTTHILSSGIAGSMVASKGVKNLKTSTIKTILSAWILTLPVTIALSAGLFITFRYFFG